MSLPDRKYPYDHNHLAPAEPGLIVGFGTSGALLGAGFGFFTNHEPNVLLKLGEVAGDVVVGSVGAILLYGLLRFAAVAAERHNINRDYQKRQRKPL